MSKVKNRGLDQYGAESFEQQQFGTAGAEGVKRPHNKIGYTRPHTDLRLAIGLHRIEVLLRSSTGHVIFKVRHVTHEAQTVFRRVRRTEQTLLNFHLSH